MLRKNVAVQTVPARATGGNPSVVVRVKRKGKFIDPYYGFMVVKKGTKLGSNAKGSRKGKNTVVEEARNKTLLRVGPAMKQQSESKTANYIQKQINRLSNK